MKITLLTGQTFDISDEIGIDIKVVKSRSIGKLTLRIDNKNRIPVLAIPKYCTRKRAINFVNDNMNWILESLNKIPKIKQFQDGESISLFGNQLVIKHITNARCGVMIRDNQLIVSGGTEFLHRRVKDFIKKQAEIEFYNISKVYAQKIGCKINGICIKDTKSRWGSCSSLNNINYSWRIALAPDYVIKYLMAHEVAHLKHHNHSADFWKCVAELYSEWEIGHNWLKTNGKNLYIYQ